MHMDYYISRNRHIRFFNIYGHYMTFHWELCRRVTFFDFRFFTDFLPEIIGFSMKYRKLPQFEKIGSANKKYITAENIRKIVSADSDSSQTPVAHI